MPKHIGIIPDGSRRWSRKNGLSLQEGYTIALNNLSNLILYGYEHNVNEFSIYLLSRENLKRHQTDLDALYIAIDEIIRTTWTELVDRYGVVIKPAGSVDQLPKYLVNNWENLLSIDPEKSSKLSVPYKLNVLLNYDPLEELRQAFMKDTSRIYENLWVNSPLELVIRTAGVALLSNFLPLQSGYAILWTSEKLFNDFTTSDLDEAIRYYDSIQHLHGV